MGSPQRVGLDHPEVCGANSGNLPCEYRRVPGSNYCPMHGGGSTGRAVEKAELRQYKLNGAFAGRVGEMSRSSDVKNLTEEIALMRVALETIFNNINDANEMLLYVDKIDKMTGRIEKLVETWQKIQERNKELLGRETVIALFDELLEIITRHVDDPDTIQNIASEGYGILSRGLGK